MEFNSDNGIAARQIAYDILNDIFIQRRSLDEAVQASSGFEKLEPRDRGFVRLLVSIVLKRARQMDIILQGFLHEPLSVLKPQSLINVFRLGFAQYAFLGTPAHAAVNTTVELVEAVGIAHQKSLVNAIMRRLTREGFPAMMDRDAGKLNTPEWLWREWMQDYGVEGALDIAEANFGEAPLDITVKGNPAAWADKLVAALLPSGSLRKLGGGFIPDMEGFDTGEWWVQNAAAALPAKVMGDVKGKIIVDLCAAPGGKTAQLAASGAHVIALDRSAKRMERLKENMLRLNLNVETIIADGATWQPKKKIDAVLLDAPCTATGTIRHQPDILHLKDMKDQEKLVALQRKLLLNALAMLKPQGILVYCTCSLQKAESEAQIDWLMEQGLSVARSPIAPDEVGGMAEVINSRGEIRCLPQHLADQGGLDGFFVARLVKVMG